jgi:hypothetical protein
MGNGTRDQWLLHHSDWLGSGSGYNCKYFGTTTSQFMG